ncbi:hypothetical protein [Halomonas sp. LBP4]|uniref:hypothetical protein n=1 Tax=Halomonas sp. LBP4 TaxID=2044917 RepID=UPI000D76704B|nr:hypothetical protein [Halomonas sp. LBP4]PXX94701.1 hypothetical protein CR157_21605 [Halomonas sp. LBP4]
MPVSHDVRTLRRDAAEIRRETGDFAPSPYPAWTAEDMAWLVGMDDASGDYPAQTPPAQSSEAQLALF